MKTSGQVHHNEQKYKLMGLFHTNVQGGTTNNITFLQEHFSYEEYSAGT